MHELHRFLAFWFWLVIVTRTGQIQQLALPHDADLWMLWFDQRPLFLNPPDWLFFNQSSSTLSCPISWYKDATRSSSARSRRSLPPEKPALISSNACIL